MGERQYSPKRFWDNLTSICQVMRLSSAQSLSRVRLFATPWTAARQAFPFITNSQSLLKLMSIELVMPSNRLILCWSLLFPTSIFPSIRVVSNESAFHMRWPKYWSFSFGINLSTKYSELIALKWTHWISLQPKDSQKSSSTPQFKSINSPVLRFNSPTLTSVYDYWKNHSFN